MSETEGITFDGWVRKEGNGHHNLVEGLGFSIKLSRHATYQGMSKKWERRRNRHLVRKRLGSTEIRVPICKWVHVAVVREKGRETVHINSKAEGETK